MIGTRVKITVLKKLDLADELGVHMTPPPDLPPLPDFPDGPPPGPECPAFQVGDEFIYELGGGSVPKGFCSWAWGDVFKDVMAVCSRAAMLPKGQRGEVDPAYTCCTDGLRPVIFKIEAYDE